jgi:5-methylcytosine-specific restriction endonuclease McrA
MTVEHVVALANGGTNEPENLRTAHRSCNSSKGARTGAEPRRRGLRRTMWRRKLKSKIPPDADVF